ncbi:hypothetical protein MKX07_006959 [Trichoderma sp. CBMAI-0711]|uniref:Predicted protein n=3 Tax=Trichoderma TaxID=5543 RepID=G0RI79_HYPJQ|nr:uncharacterized protein TRIREDRAFT_61190 [Trichoderma reesei QM6a]EGR49102.1 predicted protein [Trichoderma reesei QM6a]ETS02578.1 bola domain-containing protein [Trichoderma reesei RUT C-30]KAK1251480.1 hypothetical protein MKX07_006959 [Trichoderma sp. CBMAI-0711]OTA06059.1 BolA domain-containing protein [Trichoderma parareesei]
MASITEASLREAITQRLGAIHVQVTDMSGGCGQAFTALIVSPQFQDLKALKRHRLVNTALKDEIAAIHAWTAKCQTPQEWEAEGGGSTPAGGADAVGPSMEGTVEGHVEGTRG